MANHDFDSHKDATAQLLARMEISSVEQDAKIDATAARLEAKIADLRPAWSAPCCSNWSTNPTLSPTGLMRMAAIIALPKLPAGQK